ncbi:FRG domain-containing protein [Moritella sp. 24]|uniref:FRG domain-containing protein n=1 Tax=Moritella sp. 24 TaxID=2746230 RepID=UPI001BA6750B|nr:FRG domain-containing protein [Moritella sp. 24]QUM75522.1 FRG domain-containing protein [Moritella sp. 24]
MLPTFDYRQWYQTEINSMDELNKMLFDVDFNEDRYYRGMSNYDFVCISTLYRYFINSRNLLWSKQEVGFNTQIMLPEFDLQDYSDLSFKILDVFYDNLLTLGSKELNLNSIAYLAQHYGLPTDLIDFTLDPKVALYFACSEYPEKDCSVYMCDIYAHVKRMINACSDPGDLGFNLFNEDKTRMSPEQASAYAIKSCTTITRSPPENSVTITPIIELDEIKYSQRIRNQKGVFVYNLSTIPFDQLMYTASPETSYQGRRIYKIKGSLKKQIIRELDEKYGINKNYIYPNISEDPNLEIIREAVRLTKDRFNL